MTNVTSLAGAARLRRVQPMPEPPTPRAKRCATCGTEKPITAFLPSPLHDDRLAPSCTPCLRERAAADRAEREKRLAAAKAKAPTESKRCNCCGKTKPLTNFSLHRTARDGHRKACKTCVKANRTQPTTKPRAPTEKTPELVIRIRVGVQHWGKRNPAAAHARAVVHKALRAGTLKKPASCRVKGCDATQLEAHHGSYSKPLAILWCCRSHHKRLHNGAHLTLKAGVDRKLTRIPKEARA